MRGPKEHAVARLAASVHGRPAVNFRAFNFPIDLGHNKRQSDANKDALQYIAPQGSGTQIGKEKQADEERGAHRTDYSHQVCVKFAHAVIVSFLVQGRELGEAKGRWEIAKFPKRQSSGVIFYQTYGMSAQVRFL